MRKTSHSRPGFLLLESLIGMAVFALFIGAVGLTLLYGQESTVNSGDRMRAVFLTEQAIEAVRSIRDGSFDALVAGTHGYWMDPSTDTWVFSGSAVTQSGGYTTTLTITHPESDRVVVEASTVWKHGYNRSGSVLIATELTDWRDEIPIGNWSSAILEGSYADADTPHFNDVAVAGNYAFVTGETSDGGRGLYVFDIADPTPDRVAASFFLGYAGFDVAVKGQRLYVLTNHEDNELKVYDISDPENLGAGDLVTNENLPGNGKGVSLAVRGNTLLVGAAESATEGEDELYAFDVSDSGALLLEDSLDDPSGMNAIALSGTAAFLATTNNGYEIHAAKVNQSTNIVFPSAEGYNATDVQDGISIAVAGTSAILGRQNGTAIEELMLFSMKRNGGWDSPPPGPWYHDVGGSALEVAADPTACVAFIASDAANRQLQVVKIRDAFLPELDSASVATGDGRGIAYDPLRDRVYLITDTGFHVFKPAVGSSPLPVKRMYARPGYIFLVSVLVIGVIATATALSMLLLGWAAEQNGVLLEESAQAYENALVCLERALVSLQQDAAYAGNETLALERGSCEILGVGGAGNENRELCAIGEKGEALRRIQVSIDRLLPSVIVRQWEEVTAFTLCL